jgi:hypothetical protein
MRTIKLFLAASKKEELAAEAFDTELKKAANRTDVDLDVCAWYRDDAFPPGKNYLESLIDHCKGRDGRNGVKPSDFFAVIVSDKEAPSTSCMFELGLFLGGLGFEPERCFMLSASANESLPDALRGHASVPFKPPSNTKDTELWAKAMEEPAKTVRNRIRALPAFARPEFPVINAETLMELEALIGDNEVAQLTEAAEVLVNRAQPIEQYQQAFSAWVLQNMKRGVKYRYFFHEEENFSSIARLIYALSTVTPDSENPRKAAVGKVAPQNVIRDNLKVLQNRLSINLIPSSGPIEFCVHNIADAGRAKCYFRYPFTEKFIQWCQRGEAVHIARELTDLAKDDNDLDRLFILRSTKHFDLNALENQKTKKRLCNALRTSFKDESLNPLLQEVCFEHLTDVEVRGWNQNPWEELGGSYVQTA